MQYRLHGAAGGCASTLLVRCLCKALSIGHSLGINLYGHGEGRRQKASGGECEAAATAAHSNCCSQRTSHLVISLRSLLKTRFQVPWQVVSKAILSRWCQLKRSTCRHFMPPSPSACTAILEAEQPGLASWQPVRCMPLHTARSGVLRGASQHTLRVRLTNPCSSSRPRTKMPPSCYLLTARLVYGERGAQV